MTAKNRSDGMRACYTSTRDALQAGIGGRPSESADLLDGLASEACA
jgi:hypothetical protein